MSEEVKKIKGTWNDLPVSIKSIWGGHEFTEEEAAKLFAGETIEFEAVSNKTGNTYMAKGKLEEQEFEGHTFIGFKPIFEAAEMFEGMWNNKYVKVKREWSGHRFTDEEVSSLLAGKVIEFETTSKRTGNKYTAKGKLEKQDYNGKSFIGFKPEFN